MILTVFFVLIVICKFDLIIRLHYNLLPEVLHNLLISFFTSTLHTLQSTLLTVTGVIIKKHKFDHVTSLFETFSWFPITFGIKSKVFIMSTKAFPGTSTSQFFVHSPLVILTAVMGGGGGVEAQNEK